MKSILIVSVIIITAFTTFSFIQNNKSDKTLTCQKSNSTIKVNKQQPNFFYYVGGDYSYPVSQSELNASTKLNDIITDYPESWITNYIDASITIKNDDSEKHYAISKNNILTKEQKKLLNSAKINSDIDIKVAYTRRNSATKKIDTQHLKIELTVVPEKQAYYNAGKTALNYYLELNSKSTIDTMQLDSLKNGSILFTISEEGKAVKSFIDRTSGYSKIDALMLNLINDMPKWTPAKNAKGETVSQNFRYNFGASGC